MSTHKPGGNITLTTLLDIKSRGEKFACLTAYDACFASILSDAGVEVLLVGDSLGMVLQGHDSTLPVTMDDMIYHTSCVKRGNHGALLMADLPFMSYASESQTLENAAALMRAGATRPPRPVRMARRSSLATSRRCPTYRVPSRCPSRRRTRARPGRAAAG